MICIGLCISLSPSGYIPSLDPEPIVSNTIFFVSYTCICMACYTSTIIFVDRKSLDNINAAWIYPSHYVDCSSSQTSNAIMIHDTLDIPLWRSIIPSYQQYPFQQVVLLHFIHSLSMHSFIRCRKNVDCMLVCA